MNGQLLLGVIQDAPKAFVLGVDHAGGAGWTYHLKAEDDNAYRVGRVLGLAWQQVGKTLDDSPDRV